MCFVQLIADMKWAKSNVALLTVVFFQRNKCKWDENSKHWRYLLGKLCELQEKSPEKLVQGLKQIVMCTDDEFRIGAG